MHFFLLGLLVVLLPGGAITQAPTEDKATYFEAKIRPILEAKCSICHGDKVQMASLRLTTAEGFFKGADSGPIVVKGQPESSRLIQVVSYKDKIKMPPTGKLAQDEIDALKEWVRMGAPWPNVSVASHTPRDGEKPAGAKSIKRDHWAFLPIRDYQPPRVKNVNWVETPIDNFILAKLHEKGLEPAPPADKLTLLRRAKFDLHGLPPTMEEIKEFLGDDQPGAFARLVDRLLISPRYGEKWGRHWLDVARYADSTGVDEDLRYVHAWRYRDYVINALNEDLPYDQFIREQIAGDLFPVEGGGTINERGIVATGFLALGPKAIAQRDKVKMLYDVVDEQIDTTSKAFMGLTVACARCHDHKFDPILTKDYYSLASIFASTRTYTDSKSSSDSKFYVEPLVRRETADRYFLHQRRVQDKRTIMSAVTRLSIGQYVEWELAPRLADYMVGAYKMHHESRTVEAIAQSDRLDTVILKKWAAYLKPRDVIPAHLDQWYQAQEADLRTVAANYQKRFLEVMRKQLNEVEEWVKKAEEMVEKGERVRSSELDYLTRDVFHSEATDKEGPFGVSEEECDKVLPKGARARLAALAEQVKDLEETSPPAPPMANAVAEGEIVEQRVFIRGSHDSLGELVPKQFPLVLAGENQTPITQGSGRKELAEWLTREDNPLPARVMANRIWGWHFGEGLVRTPNDFGTRGEAPTHPELLDYLARRFVESGWSIKKMHRLIMLSNTYQMSSQVSEEAWEADASNLLWSRFNRRRLTLEEVRDGFLALGGSLDLTLGGNTDPDAEKISEEQRNNWRVQPDDSQRRSLYLPLHRNKLPTLLNLFDFGDATTSSGRRATTNIAPQALYLMNSDFAYKSAASFAARLLVKPREKDQARVKHAYLMALAREPEIEELEASLHFLKQYGRKQKSESDPERAGWIALCEAILASNEFHFVD